MGLIEGDQRGGVYGDGRRVCMKHTMEYTDVVLQSCTPEIYLMLLASVTPVDLICKKDKKICMSFGLVILHQGISLKEITRELYE